MKTYDYIVVGAGSAGAVVAARLSEDPGVTVLLVEAGGERVHRHPLIRMPIAFLKAYKRKAFSTTFEVEPEPALGGRAITSWRGRGLGGSSNVNGMMHNRGQRGDYDHWRDLGLPGWGYADILPYFRRMETSWRGDGTYHGASGPIGTQVINDPVMLYEDFEASAVEVGLPRSDDLFGDRTEGVGRLELSVGKGERSSTAHCYLDPVRGRPNLTILTHASATRLIFDHRRVTGLEYLRHGVPGAVHTDREVIVSAGAFETPKLLLLSGIGPAADLADMSIAVKADLPGVGANLMEHPMFPMVWNANRSDTFLNNLRLDRAAALAARWITTKTGPFATTACHAFVYARTLPDLESPDAFLGATAVGLDADLWFPLLTKPPVHRFVNIVSIAHPRSRGWVKLASTDPAAKPRKLYNLLSAPEDIDALIRAFKLTRSIYECGPQGASISAEAMPGATVQSDMEIADFIRDVVNVGEHPCGTCAMGVAGDPRAVVDAELRVHGIAGLRIADASVMPRITSGNINVPTIMIGEKAADLIRGRLLAAADL